MTPTMATRTMMRRTRNRRPSRLIAMILCQLSLLDPTGCAAELPRLRGQSVKISTMNDALHTKGIRPGRRRRSFTAI